MNGQPPHYFGEIPTAAAFNTLLVFGVLQLTSLLVQLRSAHTFTALVQLISDTSEFSYMLLRPNKRTLNKHAINT